VEVTEVVDGCRLTAWKKAVGFDGCRMTELNKIAPINPQILITPP
jgi:hypothetical protein